MSETQTSKDSWDGILVNYLKAENLKLQEEKFVCLGVAVKIKEIELELEQGTERYVFSLNVTNKLYLKNNGLAAPKEVIGKTLTLKKVLATNPQTKKEVESLRICGID